jgi:hypothetical protein
MKKLAIYIIILLFALGCKGEDGEGLIQNKSDIFLIIGQSNASSIAGYKEYKKSDSIFVLDATGDWVHADPSLNKFNNIPVRKNMTYGYSFGYSFALSYVGHYERDIKIISNAKGGTSIEFQLDEGMQKTFERIGPHKGRIKAILYHQGEKNYKSPDWVDNAVRLVNEYRDFIGWNVPFIFGELCSNQNFERCVGFNQFNENISNLYNYLDNIHIVSSEGIQLMSYHQRQCHFSKEGQIELGRRYFSGYQGII